MKQTIRVTALLLALLMLVSVNAFAEDVVWDDTSEKATIKKETIEGYGVTVTFEDAKDSNNNVLKDEKIKVVVEHADFDKDEHYIVLMVKSDKEGNYNTDIPETDILYINQTDNENRVDGKLEFMVYPKDMENGVILISTSTGLLKVAIVNGKYIVGDADLNGVIDVRDIMRVANIILGNNEEVPAADADQNNVIDVRDIMRVANIILGNV